MRTRSSNKTKRFSVQDYDYGISSDDGGPSVPDGPSSRRLQRAELADATFETEPEAPVSDEGVDNQDGDGDVDMSGDDLDLQIPLPEIKAESHNQRQSRRPAQGDDKYHEIPPYPSDVRVTRTYAGPMKRWERFQSLVEVLYGPDLDSLRIIDGLRARWSDRPVLPAKADDYNGGVVRSPWLPDGFEQKQRDYFRAWYDKYHETSGSVQRSHPVPPKNALKMLPQPDGDLIALVGPAPSQQQVRFSWSHSVCLQASGRPLEPAEAPEKASAGWMFDVGGIPIAAAWANRTGEVDQLLALAVIPHADQMFFGEETVKSPEDSKKAGCLQLWQFSFIKDKASIVRPSRDPPRLASVLYFDWGRPQRIQWCPVHLPPGPTYGLLGLLCDDGRLRVVDVVKKAGQPATTAHGAVLLPPFSTCARPLTPEQSGSIRPWPP